MASPVPSLRLSITVAAARFPGYNPARMPTDRFAGGPLGTLINEFTWSKSRDSLFQECLRAYYLQHYGAWGGWARTAPADVQELYVMKNLSTRAAWIGIVVHEVAERAVRAVRQGHTWTEADALAELEARMRQELELSGQGAYRRGARLRWGAAQVKALGLQEHYYGESVADAVWEDAIHLALRCVRNFFSSSAFRRITEVGPDGILSLEELEGFPIADVKVWVKLDLAMRGRDGGVVIVDWKTGAAHQADDIALQLGIYALFGSQKWSIPPGRIQGYDVNLRDGSSHRHELGAASLERVVEYVRESAARMRSLLTDPGRNRADPECFPLTDDLQRCARCRFRRACGREGEGRREAGSSGS